MVSVRYHAQRREREGTPWIDHDLKSGHVNFGFARRVAQRAKQENPGWKTRVLARVHTVEEFVVEEI